MMTGTEVLERGLWGELEGAFAHKLDENGDVRFQCQVLAVDEKHLKVQFYEWLTGCESTTGFVSRLEFDKWVFYDSSDEWNKKSGGVSYA